MKSYSDLTSKLRGIYKNIDKYCLNCDKCCFTYGWILPSEEKFYKSACDLIEINKKVCCFDSFVRDSEGRRILDIIPRCTFYKDNRCSMHKKKPFDCLLYPVKMLYSEEKKIFTLVLSLDCPYIKSLSSLEKENLKNEIIALFSKIPEDILKEYMQIVKTWSSFSVPKGFEHIILREFEASSFGF